MLKRFLTPIHSVVTVFMFAEVAAVMGVAAYPGVQFFLWAFESLPQSPFRVLLLCMAAAAAYFMYGVSLLVVLPVARVVTGAWTVPQGKYPYVSFKGYQWASYNALVLIMRYSFVNWIRATPFIRFFYRAMGMKIGQRTQINTNIISDCPLITVGKDTVIGGDVTLIGHSVEGPNIVAAPVKVGNNVTCGLMSVILPGCEIGDGAILAANAVLKKGTKVGPNEIWGGVPARKIGVRGEKSAEVKNLEDLASADSVGLQEAEVRKAG